MLSLAIKVMQVTTSLDQAELQAQCPQHFASELTAKQRILCSVCCMSQLLAYADDVNILGRSVHTVKKNAEALVAATKEIGLEVNPDKTKYMIMSRDQNAGRNNSMKNDNSSIERVQEFKYLGTMLT